MNENKQIEEMAREMCHLSTECKTCKECNEKYHGEEGELCYFQCIAKEIITHDYRKVERGEWVYDAENECFMCSNCENSALNNYRMLSVNSDFCPHCGADMRGEKDG